MTEKLFQGLGEVCIEVEDLDRSEAFYVGVLGMTVVERWRKRGVVWLDVGAGSFVALWKPPYRGTAGTRGGLRVHFGITVEDDEALGQVMERLRVAGVQFHDQYYEDTHSIYIDDPDDHIVEFATKPNPKQLHPASADQAGSHGAEPSKVIS